MRRIATTLLLGSVLAAAAMVSSLYAQGNQESGSMMGHGMMGDGSAGNDGGMMGDMKGMMKMMKQMSRMMDHCDGMMNDNRPNDQWRKDAPSQPEKKG